MPFWGGKTVNKDELRKILSKLDRSGFSDRDVSTVRQLFIGDLLERGSKRNIDKKEFGKILNWIEGNKSKHDLSSSQIETLKETFLQYL